MGTKMIIDATKPVRRPFEARIDVPGEIVERTDLGKLIPPEQMDRLGLDGTP
jgi:hypothetical protein